MAPSTKTRRFVTLLTAVAWAGFFMMLVLGVMTFMQAPWLVYDELPMQTIDASYPDGAILKMRVSRCNNSGTDQLYARGAELIRVDKPQDPISLTSSAVLIHPGCYKTISAVNTIPPKTCPGRYYLKGLAKPDGAIRNYLVTYYSNEFNVTSATPGPECQ